MYTQVLSSLLIFASILCCQAGARDEYHEDLFIKPLDDGKLFAQFRFTTLYRKDIKSLRWENKIEIFPLSIVDLVSSTDVNRLHFSLTKGNWNYQNWGYSTRPSPPGAQIRAQFSKHNHNRDRSWSRLVNLLSGKFCTSIASADKKSQVLSKLTFGPRPSSLTNHTGSTLYANLPEETFCTENLTPWKKLLPCYSKLGLASLTNAVNLLKSSYSSLSIDIEPVPCITHDNNPILDCERVQLTQMISVVFNPILLFEGKQTWSLAKIFGNAVQKKCPVASHSRIHVDITKLDDRNKLYPQSYTEQNLELKLDDGKTREKRVYATYDINALLDSHNSSEKSQVNLGIKQNQIFKPTPASTRPRVPIHFMTHIAGIGAGDGTLIASITNNQDKPVRVTYMDMVPHFLRVYLHTLTIRTKSGQELKPDKLNFILSRNSSPTLIEFSIVIPSSTTAQISYDFERAFLHWSDYKPDANKGVLLGSQILGVSLRQNLDHLIFPINSVSAFAKTLVDGSGLEGDMLMLYARPLLIILPTPDFSMPYNVICLVCTSIVAIFGVIHSMTTRKPVIKFKKQTSGEGEDEESKKDK